MILGMSISTFITVHVVLSLIGIATGLIVLFQTTRNVYAPALTAVFLAATVLTSVTGFPIPPFGLTPARAFGVTSLALLALALPALYVFKLAGHWRWIYLFTAITALYLNCFVGVVQTFLKISFFNALAPTQTEPAFAVAQLALLVVIFAAGVMAVRRFRPGLRLAVTPAV